MDHLVDTLSNGQFVDVANRPRSPYFSNTAFLASPLIADDEVFEKGDHTFFIDSRFFLHNSNVTVTQIRVDFGDGQGEWIVNNPFDTAAYFKRGINSPMGIVGSITKSIVGTLEGRIIVVLIDMLGHGYTFSNLFKITVPGGKGPDDYAALTECKGGKNPSQRWVIEAPQSRLDPINSIYGNPQLDYTTKIVQPCPGFPMLGCKVKVPVKDTAYFYFADDGSSCNRNVLKKPIVFIDGFDPTNSRGVKQIYEGYINAQVSRTVNGIPSTVLFGDYMLSQGYDFVILDYKHGNDLMERNALTLVSLLERLYQEYGSTFEQDITLIGPSMGSEVAQYALAYMEHNNIPHHVKTYISFDGPQQGANVPIGLQNFVEYLTKRGLLSKLTAVKSTIRNGLYNGLAARQLIAHHVSANTFFPTPDALRTTFLNNLQAVGNYPVLCRKVALINGVSNGVLNPDHLTNNESLIHIINKRRGWKSVWGACNWNICKNIDWEAKAAPSIGNARVSDMWTLDPIINLIFWVPPFETNKYASAAWGNSSLDNAPGSFFAPLFGTQPDNVDQDKIRFLLKEFFYLLTGSKRTTFSQNINKFSFVPSYSAADLRFPTMTDNSGKNLYMDWSKTNLCGHTPFDYVYAPKDVSQQHVAVSQQGSEWFESEVRCNVQDLPVLFNPNITGNSILCSASQYSLSFCKTGNHTTTWSVGSSGIVAISGSGDQVTLTAQGSGTVTLTATITYPCNYNSSSLTNTVTKQITVGKPIITGTYNSPTNSNEIMVPMGHWDLTTFNAACIAFETNISAPGATNIQWSGPTGGDVYWQQSGDNVFCSFTEVGQIIVLSVSATNSCGTTTKNYRFKCTTTTSCGIQPLIIVIAPNPAKTNMNVSLVQNNKMSIQQSFQKIRIIDKMGNIKQNNQYNAKTKSVSVNISLLTPDVYTIQVFDGSTWYSEKFIKN